MASVLRFLGLLPPKRQAPPTVPSDEIIPMSYFDTVSSINHLVMAWYILFNDVLDAGKLRDSLERLVSTGTWRKLGGRIRRNVSNNPLRLSSPPPNTHTHIQTSDRLEAA